MCPYLVLNALSFVIALNNVQFKINISVLLRLIIPLELNRFFNYYYSWPGNGLEGELIMWLFFALATTFIWGLAELFYKKGARPDEKYAHLKICISVGFVMGLHALYTLLTKDIGYDPENLIRYLPVSLFYVVSMAFSFFGMRFI